MGDVSAEPSMEDILSSIKRIIAEEGDVSPRARRPAKATASSGAADAGGTDNAPADEVLELSDPMPHARPHPTPVDPVDDAADGDAAIAPPDDTTPISSHATVEASRGSLEALSRLVVTPQQGGDGTLEGLVRDMLRPMLREWLDQHLPPLVETLVAREIARIAGSR